jgi:hypothetical protein
MRAILLTLGWLGAGAGLYLMVVSLDVYWNLFNWHPELDLIAWGFLVGIFAVLVALRLLAGATNDRVSRVVSLVVCLALLVLAVYVLPREPLTGGVFGRDHSSALWYRSGRSIVLSLPSAFWVLGLFRLRRGARLARVG